MAETPLESLYGCYEEFLKKAEDNAFGGYFRNALDASECRVTAYEKYIERNIDLRWVEAMEACVIPLDTIIRNPNRVIRREEDVVPIEMARNIGPEAVRHLSQHTNMIASVTGGEVKPSRILNVTKEDAVDTYENRFIMTLLQRMEYFLDKRMAVLMKGAGETERYDYRLEGSLTAGGDTVHYSIGMQLETPHADTDDGDLLAANVENMSGLARIERLRKIIYNFRGARLIRELQNAPLVRPPLTMTNVLKKNPNFAKCVELWGFISSYDGVGFTMQYVETQGQPDEKAVADLKSLVMMEYVMMKRHTRGTAVTADLAERRRVVSPKIVMQTVELMTEVYDMSIDEVKRVFLKTVSVKEKARNAEKTKMREVLARAVSNEKQNLQADEKKRERRLRQEKKAAAGHKTA